MKGSVRSLGIFFVILLFLSVLIFAGPSNWVRFYSGDFPWGNIPICSSENGFVVSGGKSCGEDTVGFEIVKLTFAGNPYWGKIYYTEENYEDLFSYIDMVYPNPDGSYIIGGEVKFGYHFFGAFFTLEAYAFLSKVDSDGNVLWSKFYKKVSVEGEYLYEGAMIPVSDGGVIIVGIAVKKNSGNEGSDSQSIIFKIDSEGNIVWKKSFPDLDYYLCSIIKVDNDNYLISGNNSKNSIIIKIDSSGNIIWSKKIVNKTIISLLQAPDGNIILLEKFGLIKISQSGKIFWGKYYHNGYAFAHLEKMCLTKDGELFIIGKFWFQENAPKEVFLKIDLDGNVVWAREWNYPSIPNFDYAEIFNTNDNGVLVSAYYVSDERYIILKFDLEHLSDSNSDSCDLLSDYSVDIESYDVSILPEYLSSSETNIISNTVNLETCDVSSLSDIVICWENILDDVEGKNVDIVDLSRIMNMISGNLGLDPHYDLNGDGKVDVSDAEILSQFIVSNLFY